jgi:hypothetical protein
MKAILSGTRRDPVLFPFRCVACAVSLAVVALPTTDAQERRAAGRAKHRSRPAVVTPERPVGPIPSDAPRTLRMRVETPEGVLVVYDAPSPPGVGEGCSGYLAYWLSTADTTPYVFPAVLEKKGDLATALLALERDLGVGVEALADSDDRVDGALRSSSKVPNEEIVWEPATLRRAVEIMGFDAGDDSNLPEPGDGQTAGPCDPSQCPESPSPPSDCGSPGGLAREALSVVAGCCLGGGVTPPGPPLPPPPSPPPCECCWVITSGGVTFFAADGTVTPAVNCCSFSGCCDFSGPCGGSGGPCVCCPLPVASGAEGPDSTVDDGSLPSRATRRTKEGTLRGEGSTATDNCCLGGWCDDGDPCTFGDNCNSPSGPALTCRGVPMVCSDDGNVCTWDHCVNGACVHDEINCDDGDRCTIDSCAAATGCIHTPKNCDDGNVCTINDRCVNGGCLHDPMDCDDGDLCSVEMGCDPAVGCVRRWMTCGDDNPCTADECNGATGSCLHTAVAGPCDDSDPCTLADTCTNGNCVGTRDPGCQCPFDYTVDGEGAGEGVRHERTTRVPIATGTRCVWVRAEYFTREFPVYTGQQSVYNDEVSFSVRYPGGTAAAGSAVVNDLHALFAAGGTPAWAAFLDFSTWAQNSPSWIETTAAATNVGDGLLGSGVRFQINCGPGATLSVDPSGIPAHTGWESMPDYSYSEITVQWDPPECEGTLKILDFVGDSGYTPPNKGTLAPIDATKWRYTAFDEPPTELCPKAANVPIAAMQGDTELARVSIRVLPVHTWWTTGHKHGPGGQTHPPDTSDFTNDYNFLRWKYATVLATTAGTFSSVTISTNPSVTCGVWPFQTIGYACTTINPLTSTYSVVFGTNTFSGSENQAASIIGHELRHTAVGLSAGECPAYQWEKDNDAGTGIFPCDSAYLDEVRQQLFNRGCP